MSKLKGKLAHGGSCKQTNVQRKVCESLSVCILCASGFVWVCMGVGLHGCTCVVTENFRNITYTHIKYTHAAQALVN